MQDQWTVYGLDWNERGNVGVVHWCGTYKVYVASAPVADVTRVSGKVPNSFSFYPCGKYNPETEVPKSAI